MWLTETFLYLDNVCHGMVTTDAAHQFWTEDTSDLQEIAKTFEQNIEYRHPSGASCFCGPSCPWAATTVTYPSYNGPRVSHL